LLELYVDDILSIGAKTESSDEQIAEAAPWGTWIAKELTVLD
jgi:hypothetical protein